MYYIETFKIDAIVFISIVIMFFMSHRLIIFSISQFVATDNITWWGQRTNLQITDKLWLINLMVEESMDSYNKWTHGTLHLGNLKNCDRYQSVNWGPSWQWSCGRWIYNYLCKQCLSPLMRVRISIRARCTTLCDKVCQSLATGRWFSPGTPVSSTNKSDCHDIAVILLKLQKVALNIIKQTYKQNVNSTQYCSEDSYHNQS